VNLLRSFPASFPESFQRSNDERDEGGRMKAERRELRSRSPKRLRLTQTFDVPEIAI
jgi:hypothetical protein